MQIVIKIFNYCIYGLTHLKKKTIIIGVVCLFSFFCFLQIYRDYKLINESNSSLDHLVEIDNSEITGYSNNKIIWLITAKNIWAGHNKNLLMAD
ncbi:MAG: hypothetical protein WC860_00910, partial [Candidatus Margulisiibacteriota bacterium]